MTSESSTAGLPPEAINSIVGGRGGVELAVTQAEGLDVEVRETILSASGDFVQSRESIEGRRASAIDTGADAAGDRDANAMTVRDDMGRVSMYVRFEPARDADAPSRVDWARPENVAEPRRALLQAEEGRRAEIRELLEVSRERFDAAAACQWDDSVEYAHAAHVWCFEEDVDSLRALAFVESVTPNLRTELTSTGDYYRSALGLQYQQALDEGHDGETGRAAEGRADVEVALIDSQGFYRAWLHDAYNDSSTAGSTRITRRRDCRNNPCVTDSTTDLGTQGGHGARIMGAFADLLDSQVPLMLLALQEARSYGAPEAALELYWVDTGTDDLARAIVDAASTDDGVDLISVSLSAGTCGNPSSVSNVRDAWNTAYSLGVLGVLSAGNKVDRDTDACLANGLATRPDIVVVGAYGDDVSALNGEMLAGRAVTPIAGWDLDTQPLMGWHWSDTGLANNCPNSDAGDDDCWLSALGGAHIRLAGGVQNTARAIVDVVGPAGWTESARFIGGSESYGGSCCGTSESAPMVAAGIASLFDFAHDYSYGTMILPGVMHANVLVMGDGARGSTDPGGRNMDDSFSELDHQWGVGRFQLRVFSGDGMDAPWAWRTGWYDLADGEVVDFELGTTPLSSDVEFARAAIVWDEPHVDSDVTTDYAADIILSLVATTPTSGTCPNPGGTGGTVLAQDLSYDTEKMVTVQDDDLSAAHGKCLWVRVRGYDVPDNGDGADERRIFRAAYFEDRDREVAESIDDIY